MKTKAWALALMVLALPARAEFFSGNQLLAKMRDESVVERSFAMGYVSGVADALIGVSTCPPDGITVGQVRDMTQRLLENVPAERHKSADIFVRAVMVTQWPCKKTGGATGV